MSEAKQSNIQIEVSPIGIIVRAEYTGTLASIPAAVEQLRVAGIVELVKASQVCPPAASAPLKPTQRATRVNPEYDGSGNACCPVHHTWLSQGQFGAYCSEKAKPGEAANPKGFCALKFNI